MIGRTTLAALLLSGAAVLAQPADRIPLYCGGGFTGGGGGVAAEADGRLLRLSRPRAGAPLEEIPIEDRTAPFARWSDMLDAAGFDRLPRGAPSNMTCSLTRGTHHVLWPGTETSGSLPAPLRDLVGEMRAATRQP